MKHVSTFRFLLIAICLALSNSCVDEPIDESQSGSNVLINKVSEMRTYFESNSPALCQIRLGSSSCDLDHGNTRSESSFSPAWQSSNLVPDWDKVRTWDAYKCFYAEVPLKGDGIYRSSFLDLGRRRKSYPVRSFLVLVNDKATGTINYHVVTTIVETQGNKKPSEEDFHYIGNSDFNGFILFSKVDGTSGKALHIRNHKSHLIRIGSPISSVHASSSNSNIGSGGRGYVLSLTPTVVRYSYDESGGIGGSGDGTGNTIYCALCGKLYDIMYDKCPNGCDVDIYPDISWVKCNSCGARYDGSFYSSCPYCGGWYPDPDNPDPPVQPEVHLVYCYICSGWYDTAIYSSCPNGCSSLVCKICGHYPCTCIHFCERCGSPDCPGPWYCMDDCAGEKCSVCGGYKTNTRSGSSCPECTCEATKKEITLKLRNSKIDLLGSYGLSILVPTSEIPTDVEFQIKQNVGGQWWTLQKGTLLTCELVSLKAGHWEVKAIVTMRDNSVVIPKTKNLEVRYPDAATIRSNASVTAKMDEVWALTKSSATKEFRQEKGFWIYLNTGTRQYEFGDVLSGPLVENKLNTHGSVAPGNPIKEQEPLSPLEYGVSSVAFFHSHTPLTYCLKEASRPVGFSDADNNWANDHTPLFLYDYIGGHDQDLDCMVVRGGHSINDNAQISYTGIRRRKTP